MDGEQIRIELIARSRSMQTSDGYVTYEYKKAPQIVSFARIDRAKKFDSWGN